jgi:putative hydrolase of the HAD superfamily
MIKCVISDLGNVVLFFNDREFFQKMAEYCPFSADEIAEKVLYHRDVIQSFATGQIEPSDFYTEVVRKLEANLEQEPFFNIYCDVFSSNPPVLDLLKRLKSTQKLILLSNTDVEHFGHIKNKFPEIFIFDDYVLSFEVGCMKPHPGIYKVALKKANVRADECVFLDDLEENIWGAQRLGMNTVLYGPQTDLESELKRMNVIIK